MATRLQNISSANPGVVANRSFIAAVYQEAMGRPPTEAEYKRFATAKTKDVANIVLRDKSPFKTAAGGSGAGGTKTSGPLDNLPDELKNNPYFKQLDPDNQALLAYNWSVLNSQNKEKIKAFHDALGEATKQADPYWAEKINIVKDSLQRTLGTYDADLASQQKELAARRDYITEQLKSGSAYITAEQQAELGRQAQAYDVQIHNIGEEMANKGLTASTLNARARSQAAEQNTGVVESINRSSEKQLSDLTTGSNADIAGISAQLSDLQRRALEQKTSLIRSTESQIGSSALGGLSLDQFMAGGITGSLAEDKAADIFNRTTALASSRGF